MTTLAGREITGPIAWMSSKTVSTASSWRTMRPVLISAKCTGCMVCWKFCPDVAVEMEGKKVRFDLNVCKGCGVCFAVCAPKAIEMVTEGL